MKKMITLVIITSIILCGCSTEAVQSEDVSVPKTDLVEEQPVFYLGGQVSTEQSADISVPFTGRVQSVLVQEGQTVSKGDSLVLYENEEVIATVEIARKAVLAAKANYDDAKAGARSEKLKQAEAAYESASVIAENTKKELERQTVLYDAGVISEAVLEAYKSKESGARATLVSAKETVEMLENGQTDSYMNVLEKKVDQAQANLDSIQTTLEKRTVKAPFDGVVVSCPAKAGETYLYKTTLLTIVNSDVLTVNAYGPSSAAAHFESGQRILVNIDELPKVNIQGTVNWVGNTIDSNKRDVLVKVTLDPNDELMAGMFAEIAPVN